MGNDFRILFDCHSFDTAWQGTTTYLAGILNELPGAAARLMPELHLQIICAAEREDNIRRHVGIDFEFVPIRIGFIHRNLVDIPNALRRTGADLAVSQYVRPFISPCPTLSIIHDVLFLDYPKSFPWSYRTVRKWLFRWSAHRSSLVSTVSRYSAGRIAVHFGIKTSDILIVPNAVDAAFVAVASKSPVTSDGPLRLLSVSRLERRKRHEWSIRAMDALAADGIQSELTIVGSGDGPYADELKREVEEARTQRTRKISMKSGISISELAAEYARADIFLFPSEAEGFGIPVIEAAAAGTPCVVSSGGALVEFDGYFQGASFAAEEFPAFLTAVQSVAKNLAILRDRARSNRTAVAECFTWTAAAEGYIEAIRRLERPKV